MTVLVIRLAIPPKPLLRVIAGLLLSILDGSLYWAVDISVSFASGSSEPTVASHFTTFTDAL